MIQRLFFLVIVVLSLNSFVFAGSANMTAPVLSNVTGLQALTGIPKGEVPGKPFVKKMKEKETSKKAEGGKSRVVALLLCMFLGVLGIHRFYMGNTVVGIIQLLTGGGLGIWVAIDFWRIVFGGFKDTLMPW